MIFLFNHFFEKIQHVIEQKAGRPNFHHQILVDHIFDHFDCGIAGQD